MKDGKVHSWLWTYILVIDGSRQPLSFQCISATRTGQPESTFLFRSGGSKNDRRTAWNYFFFFLFYYQEGLSISPDMMDSVAGSSRSKQIQASRFSIKIESRVAFAPRRKKQIQATRSESLRSLRLRADSVSRKADSVATRRINKGESQSSYRLFATRRLRSYLLSRACAPLYALAFRRREFQARLIPDLVCRRRSGRTSSPCLRGHLMKIEENHRLWFSVWRKKGSKNDRIQKAQRILRQVEAWF